MASSKIELTREITKENIDNCNSDTQFYYDGKAAYLTHTVGQRILLYDPANKKGICKKLRKRWIGPFFITATSDGYIYKLRRCDNSQELKSMVHSNRLRPFNDSSDLFYTRNAQSADPDTTTQQGKVTQPNDANSPSTDLSDGWYGIVMN